MLGLRRERRLGLKRLRNELIRLHDVRLSLATIHKILVRHEASPLAVRIGPSLRCATPRSTTARGTA
jgi:hypothetical protein